MRLIVFMFVLLVFLSCTTQQTDSLGEENTSFFSLKELKSSDKKYLAPVQYVQSSDDIKLAYRVYEPPNPKAILIFYHGAGAHSGLSYNHLGVGLSKDFDVAVYMPDLRGHGYSEGSRGDSPSPEQVWKDVNSIINHVRIKHSDLPLYLGGHSGGAGLALNYSSWPDRLPIEGYVFIAPYFGYRSKTEYEKKKVEFTSVDVSAFVINSISGGLLMGHSKAVRYHFPEDVLEQNTKIVTFNTVNMSNALTPNSPHSQFSKLNKFGLWIGKNDEAFDPSKVVKFSEHNRKKEAISIIKTVDGLNHFSILLKSHKLIGPWLLNQI